LVLAGCAIAFAGCNSGDNIQVKDVGYKIEVQPTKKIEDLPKELQPRKGQTSRNIKRDPSGINR
jgi:hypothetical protein